MKINIVIENEIVDSDERAAREAIAQLTLGVIGKGIRRKYNRLIATIPLNESVFCKFLNDELGTPVYEYDWSKKKTTDPRLSSLPVGNNGLRVLINGEEVKSRRLVRAVTGENGLVETLAEDGRGRLRVVAGSPLREYRRGRVEVDISKHYVEAVAVDER